MELLLTSGKSWDIASGFALIWPESESSYMYYLLLTSGIDYDVTMGVGGWVPECSVSEPFINECAMKLRNMTIKRII